MGKKTRMQFTLLDRNGRQAMEKFQRRCLAIMTAPEVLVLFNHLKREIKAGASLESYCVLTGNSELDPVLTKMISDKRAQELLSDLLAAIERGQSRLQRVTRSQG